VTSSAEGDRLNAKPELRFAYRQPPSGTATFTIDDSIRLQTIAGFGASFNEAGLVTLNRLAGPVRQMAVLQSLFNPLSGAGFSAMKTPIAGTDFMSASPQWYSYDDVPGDTDLSHFSISRDLQTSGLITYIKRAYAAGGKFVLEAPMDYPPDWMLVNPEANQDVAPGYYGTLARYFVRYLTAYQMAGVHIDYLSPFNEPGNYTEITMPELQTLIRDHVGPALLASSASSTHLMVSEVVSRSRAASAYPVVLGDAKARSYISVLGYHGYGDLNYGAIRTLHAAYPDLPLWMTEYCCYFSQGDGMRFETGDFWGNLIVSDLEAGASAWIYWNAILDQNGGPWLVSTVHKDPVANSQNSVVVIDTQQQSVTYTGLYYYLAHFSRFVRPGAVRIGTEPSSSKGVRCISFQNADGSIVSELINSSSSDVPVAIDWHGQSIQLTLPGLSITTARWVAPTSP
jgi:glucosylceramidase